MNENEPDRRGIRASKDSPDFLLEFDTPDPLFHRGFQCGEIWACLTDGVQEVNALITADNAEMVMRMTEATGYSFAGRYLTQAEIESLELEQGEWLAVLLRI